MLSWLVSRLPAALLRKVGRWQFTMPVLGPVIGLVGREILAKRGVIRHGIGAGLRFDASGGAPGYLFGTSEPEEQAVLARYLKPGDTFYDIGANVGFFATLAACLVGPEGRVYAFEPAPRCAAAVRTNARLNGFTHVEVIEAAVSSAPGTAALHLGHISGASTIVEQQKRSANAVTVPVTSIDSFLRRGAARPPNVIMIDAEGAEIEVLRGLCETIVRHRPIIMCEVHWLGAPFLDYCSANLCPLGYTVRPLLGGEFPAGSVRYHALMLPNGACVADDSAHTDVLASVLSKGG